MGQCKRGRKANLDGSLGFGRFRFRHLAAKIGNHSRRNWTGGIRRWLLVVIRDKKLVIEIVGGHGEQASDGLVSDQAGAAMIDDLGYKNTPRTHRLSEGAREQASSLLQQHTNNKHPGLHGTRR